jgi:hypothetical protein
MIKNKIYLPAKRNRVLKMKYKFLIKKIDELNNNNIYYIANGTGLNTIKILTDLKLKSEQVLGLGFNGNTFPDKKLNYYLIKQLYLTIKQFTIKILEESKNDLI